MARMPSAIKILLKGRFHVHNVTQNLINEEQVRVARLKRSDRICTRLRNVYRYLRKACSKTKARAGSSVLIEKHQGKLPVLIFVVIGQSFRYNPFSDHDPHAVLWRCSLVANHTSLISENKIIQLIFVSSAWIWYRLFLNFAEKHGFLAG